MRLVSVCAVVAVMAMLAGCGGGGSRSAATHRALRQDTISYDGMQCAPSWGAVRAGTYAFAIQDRAQDVIAMTLIDTGTGAAVGSAVPVQPGATVTARRTLVAGTAYQWRCETPSQPAALSVPASVPGGGGRAGSTSLAPLAIADLYQPLARYTRHERTLLATVRGRLAVLGRALATGDRAAAGRAWLAGRTAWLELGQDDGAYGAFGELGSAIDGLAQGDPGTTSSPSFTGFHKVEYDLYTTHDLVTARRDAGRLSAAVASITPAALAGDLPATTAGMASWVLRAHEILEDALRDTLSGADDYGAHDALATVRADVSATREMLSALGGTLSARAPGLVPTAARQLDAVDAAVGVAPVGVPVARLPSRVRQRLNAAVGAALETLAPVSELMQLSASSS